MKILIELPKGLLQSLRHDLKLNYGSITELSKRTGFSIKTISIMLKGDRKFYSMWMPIIVEGKKLIHECNEKSKEISEQLEI